MALTAALVNQVLKSLDKYQAPTGSCSPCRTVPDSPGLTRSAGPRWQLTRQAVPCNA